MGPLIGGLIAENLGMRNVFLLVGFFLFLVSLLTFWGIEEDYEPLPKEEQKIQLAVAHVHSAKRYPLGTLFDQHDH